MSPSHRRGAPFHGHPLVISPLDASRGKRENLGRMSFPRKDPNEILELLAQLF